MQDSQSATRLGLAQLGREISYTTNEEVESLQLVDGRPPDGSGNVPTIALEDRESRNVLPENSDTPVNEIDFLWVSV